MSAHEMKRRMEAIQAARAEAIEPLVKIQGQRADLLRQLAELDGPYGKAYADAEAAGWTLDELTAIGAEEPTRRPKGRPRSKRPTVRKAAQTATPESSSSAASVPAQDSTGSKPLYTAGLQPS